MRSNRTVLIAGGLAALGIILIGIAVFIVIGDMARTDAGLPIAEAATPGQIGVINPEPTPSSSPMVGSAPDPEETSEASDTGVAQPPGMVTANPTASGPTSTPFVAREVGDTYDRHDTMLVQDMVVGNSVNGSLAAAFDAHNYVFAGTKGQVVSITLTGAAGTDMRMALFQSNGTLVAENDDSGGTMNPYIEVTLPADDTYTIRVTAWVIGDYTLTLD